MTQKTIYQHFGEYLDLKNGIQYTGCFKTSKEAGEWRDEVIAKGANQGSIGSGFGVSPYERWQSYFDVDAYMAKLGEWLGDYEITGRD